MGKPITDYFPAGPSGNVVDADGFDGTIQFNPEIITGTGTVTLSLESDDNGVKTLDLQDNVTLAAPTLTAGKAGSAIMYIVQDSTGGRQITWDANFKLNAGEVNETAESISVAVMTWIGDGVVDVTIVPRV